MVHKCSSCKKGKIERCIRCGEIVKCSCKCQIEMSSKFVTLEGVIIVICDECLNELKIDQKKRT